MARFRPTPKLTLQRPKARWSRARGTARRLEETVAALDRALAQGTSGHEELIAEELRAAATTLGRLTGRVDVEDILDVIFRDFCIGK